MPDPLEPFIEENSPVEIQLNPEHLLLSFWRKPSAVYGYLQRYEPRRHVNYLLALTGAVAALSFLSLTRLGNGTSSQGVIVMVGIMGGVSGIFWYTIWAWIMSGMGRWLKGKAGPGLFKMVVAWSGLPIILKLPFLVFGFYLTAESHGGAGTAFQLWAGLFNSLIGTGLNIWALILLVKGVAVIQNFQTGKAILNVVLPWLVLIVPIIVMIFVADIIRLN